MTETQVRPRKVQFEAPPPDPRAKLTPAQFSQKLVLQGGQCACCPARGPYEADHIIPLALGGTNEFFNWQLLCVPCHKAKTADDKARIAKAERQGGRKGQYARRQKNGAQMASRGFQKTLRKKMNGTVERKDG